MNKGWRRRENRVEWRGVVDQGMEEKGEQSGGGGGRGVVDKKWEKV